MNGLGLSFYSILMVLPSLPLLSLSLSSFLSFPAFLFLPSSLPPSLPTYFLPLSLFLFPSFLPSFLLSSFLAVFLSPGPIPDFGLFVRGDEAVYEEKATDYRREEEWWGVEEEMWRKGQKNLRGSQWWGATRGGEIVVTEQQPSARWASWASFSLTSLPAFKLGLSSSWHCWSSPATQPLFPGFLSHVGHCRTL